MSPLTLASRAGPDLISGVDRERPDENSGVEPGVIIPIPRVFQDLIDDLGMPDFSALPDEWTLPDDER